MGAHWGNSRVIYSNDSAAFPLGDMGAHWGSSRVIFGLYRDNGEENGNYYLGPIQIPNAAA